MAKHEERDDDRTTRDEKREHKMTEGPVRPAPLPAPPPKRDTRTEERPDPLTHVILEDGNAAPDTGVVTAYEVGPEPPRAFQLNGKYYEHARVDEKTGVQVYRWNDWR